MTGYGLIAAVVQAFASLAWPAALVWIVWMFRERLGALLPLLRVKHKDWEASFFRLEQAEKEAAELPVPAEGAAEPTPEETNKFEQIASLSPTAAMMEVRRELENVLKNRAARYGLDLRDASILSVTRILRKKQLIDNLTSAILDDLRVVGNQAAHGDREIPFTKEDAIRYRKLVDQVIEQLEMTDKDFSEFGADASLTAPSIAVSP